MASTTFPLNVVLRGSDQGASKAITNVGVRMDALGKKVSGFGQKFMTNLSLPAIAGIGAIFKVGTGVEDALKRMQVLAGASEAQVKDLRESAKQTSREVGRSWESLARSQYDFMQSGRAAEVAMVASQQAGYLSVLANEDLAQSTESLIALVDGYALKQTESARVTRVVAASALASSTSITKLKQATAEAAPTARAFNQSLETTTAVLAALQKAGLDGGRAVSTYRALVGKLGAPQKAQVNALAQIGLSPSDLRDSEGRMLDLLDVLGLLEARGLGNQAVPLFGEEQAHGVIALLAQGSAEIARIRSEQEKLNVTRSVGELMDAGRGSITRFTTELGNLANAFFESGLGAGVTGLITRVTGWLQTASDATSGTHRFAGGLLVAAAAGGPLIYGTGKAISIVAAFGGGVLKVLPVVKAYSLALFTRAIPATWAFTAALLSNPITWWVVGIGAAIGLLVKLQRRFDFVGKTINWLKSITPDWLVRLFGGDPDSGGSVVRASFGPGGGPAGPPALTGGLQAAAVAGRGGETRVRVDFSNVPEGVRVAAERDDGELDLRMGLAMSGA